MAALAVASPVRAEERAGANEDAARPAQMRGVQLGVGIAYAAPMGNIGTNSSAYTSLSNMVEGQVPVTLEGGYRLDAFYFGLALAAGWGVTGSGDAPCRVPGGPSCSHQDYRIAGGVRAYFLRSSSVSPWAGVGFGWELLAQQLSSGAGSASGTFDGPIVPIEVGVDFASRSFAVGPYVGAAIGEFVHRTESPTPAFYPTSFGRGEAHVWWSIGLRGSFGFF